MKPLHRNENPLKIQNNAEISDGTGRAEIWMGASLEGSIISHEMMGDLNFAYFGLKISLFQVINFIIGF